MRPLLRTRFDRLALPLGLLGLAAIAVHNWRLWQRDKAFLAQKADPPPLPPLREWPALPTVSVLVAAWNEAEHIERHIASFLALRYPHKELVLCAGGEDGTYDIARRCADARVQVLRQMPGEGKQRALARSFPQTTGEIIFLTDADCLLDDEAFERTLLPLAGDQTTVATGMSQPLPEQRFHPLAQYQWSNDIVWAAQMSDQANGILGRNCALLRTTIRDIGAFSAHACTGTDYVMSQQLREQGYTIRAVPGSHVKTHYPTSSLEYLHMWRRWNKNLLVHGLRYKAFSDVWAVVTAALLALTVIVLPVLTPLFGIFALMPALLLLFTASLNRVRRMLMASELSGITFSFRQALRAPFFTFLDLLAGLMAVYDSLHPRLRDKW